MKYFLLKTDPLFAPLPEILDWFQSIDRRNIRLGKSGKIRDRQLFFIRDEPNVVFPDVLSFPFFMITEELWEVTKLYEPCTIFKEIVLLAQKSAKTCIYYLPVLEYVDCLTEASELTLDRSKVLKAVISREKVGDRSIFYVESVGDLHVIARLDIVESFLRRGATGLGLEEVAIANA